MVARLDLEHVEIRGGPPVPVSDAEVDEMEARLGVRFPDGYREYVTRLGEGMLNAFVRVLPPWRILAEVDQHRGLMSAYWLWESGRVPFRQEQGNESIPIADTMDGDVIVFHPSDPGRIIILPRHADRLYARGPDLLEAINWVCSEGPLRRFGPRRYFEAFDSRLEHQREGVADAAPQLAATSFATEPPRLDRPPREVLLAYFAELRAVEEWATAQAGGHAGFLRDTPPDPDDGFELIARSAEVHARYCTPALAQALSHASVAVSATPQHDPAAIEIIDENGGRPGRVVIRTAEADEYSVFRRRYVLENSGGEWRISSRRDLGMELR